MELNEEMKDLASEIERTDRRIKGLEATASTLLGSFTWYAVDGNPLYFSRIHEELYVCEKAQRDLLKVLQTRYQELIDKEIDDALATERPAVDNTEAPESGNPQV